MLAQLYEVYWMSIIIIIGNLLKKRRWILHVNWSWQVDTWQHVTTNSCCHMVLSRSFLGHLELWVAWSGHLIWWTLVWLCYKPLLLLSNHLLKFVKIFTKCTKCLIIHLYIAIKIANKTIWVFDRCIRSGGCSNIRTSNCSLMLWSSSAPPLAAWSLVTTYCMILHDSHIKHNIVSLTVYLMVFNSLNAVKS